MSKPPLYGAVFADLDIVNYIRYTTCENRNEYYSYYEVGDILMRNTRQRQVVLDIVRNTDTHPTADWVYEQARKVIPNISLGTVYRLLGRLREEGLVAQLETGSRKSRFDGQPGPHQHIVCERCGRIADVPDVVDQAARERVQRLTGYRVSAHRVEWFGLCPECQRRQGSILE